MADHSDPIDRIYSQAEGLLDDRDAAAARRARLLGAIAHEPPTPAGRSILRRDGWLAAASIAGLGVFLASRIYQPLLRPTPSSPAFSAPADELTRRITSPPERAKAILRTAQTPVIRPIAPAPLAEAPQSLDIQPMASPPPPPATTAGAFSAEPSPPPPQQVIVTGERRAPAPMAGKTTTAGARDENLAALGSAREAYKPALPAPPPLLIAPRASIGLLPDQVARLRAASGAGRLSEMADLLAQGVPVDAQDADGETALMKSIEADEPAAASLLIRNGAKLDERNHAGVSARQLLTVKGDPALEKAVGMAP